MTFIGLVLSGHNRGPKNIRVLIIILTLNMARVRYTTIIQKFREKGEKSGWTYIDVPADVANRLKRVNELRSASKENWMIPPLKRSR